MTTVVAILGLLGVLVGGAAGVRRTFRDAELTRGTHRTIHRFLPVLETISEARDSTEPQETSRSNSLV